MFAIKSSLTFVKTMVTTRESRAMAVRNWMNWIIIAWTQCSVVDLEPYPIVVWPSRANRNAVVKSKTWSTHVLCSSYVPSFQAVISPFCHAINQYISPNNNQRPESKVKGSYKLMLARWRYSASWVDARISNPWTSYILGGRKKPNPYRKSGIDFFDLQPSKLKPFLVKTLKLTEKRSKESN